MNRRSFLKWMSATGMTLALPRRVGAAPSTGPWDTPRLWVMVHAAGGWDPTALCDPKGRQNESVENPINLYFTDEIVTVGAFQLAPIPGHKEFFEKYANQLVVFNGVDCATNSHDAGTRNTWSGKLTEGYPSFSALYAAVAAPSYPMSFVTNGGYDYTAGLVAPTRVGNPDVLAKLAYPNRSDVNDPAAWFQHPEVFEQMKSARDARLARLQEKQGLPKALHSQSMLSVARLGDTPLESLMTYLPPSLDNSDNLLKRQAEVAVAAFASGLSVAANLTLGGFDTHGNHDESHYPRLQKLLAGVDYLWELAATAGIADRLGVLIGSDFGRTPWYNAGKGKDHWSITSMIVMGMNLEGNRVIGGTDSQFKPLNIDPKTLKLSEKGVRITPEHVHKALRIREFLDPSPLGAKYPLTAEDLPLFD
ncbi:MAG: DUF1501 domain-containing protein [Myxococcales bacterium]|nr:DUF1501 domain-containing protein [Myxococcales bacterium]